MPKKSGRKIREKACEFAAIVLSGTEAPYSPHLWALAVFFEKYIREGPEATQDEFGPSDGEVVKLEVVK